MTPQTILIYGTPVRLAGTSGAYRVTNPKTGTVLTQQPSRFLAVARAAEAIRTQRTQ